VQENSSDKIEPPDDFQLAQNFPNPFNLLTTIRFSLSRASFVNLKIYDMLEREVETLVHEYREAGNYEFSWRPIELASGLYFYRLEVGDYCNVKKLLLQK
jgi:hypothetical protein